MGEARRVSLFARFDEAGRYRSQDENGQPIDTSTAWVGADVQEVSGVQELMQLLAREHEVHDCQSWQWLSFLLWRDLKPATIRALKNLAIGTAYRYLAPVGGGPAPPERLDRTIRWSTRHSPGALRTVRVLRTTSTCERSSSRWCPIHPFSSERSVAATFSVSHPAKHARRRSLRENRRAASLSRSRPIATTQPSWARMSPRRQTSVRQLPALKVWMNVRAVGGR